MRVSLVPNREHLRRLVALGPEVRDTFRMDDPSLLRALGATHRKQAERIFASEGTAGGAGKFAALNPKYAARKRGAAAGKTWFNAGLTGFLRGDKILTLSGDMRRRFTRPGPGYFERFVPRGTVLGIFQFGAASNVAAAHLHGNPSLAPTQSAVAKSVFGGMARNLPKRDMVTKSAAMLDELRETLRAWYAKKVQQRLRARARLASRSRR